MIYDNTCVIYDNTCVIYDNTCFISPVHIGHIFKELDLLCFDLHGPDARFRFIVHYRPPGLSPEANDIVTLLVDCLDSLFDTDVSVIYILIVLIFQKLTEVASLCSWLVSVSIRPY